MSVHSRAYYEKLLENSNIQAYLLTIRKGEGTLGQKGYSIHYGGGTIETLSKNPTIGKKWTAGKYTSSAVGAYQFLNSVKRPIWPNIASRLGFSDFNPRNQDIGALYLIDEKNALTDIINGNIVSAIEKTNGIWASLPGSKHGQPTQKLKDALNFYQKQGGAIGGNRTQKSINDASILMPPKVVVQEVLPPEFNRFRNWPLAEILAKKEKLASQKLVDMPATIKLNGTASNIPLQKPNGKKMDATHNSSIATALSSPLTHPFPETSALRLSIEDRPFRTENSSHRGQNGYQRVSGLQIEPIVMRQATDNLHKNEVNLSPLFSNRPNIWSVPRHNVNDQLLAKKLAILKPLPLIDSAKTTEKMNDNSNYKLHKDSLQGRNQEFPVPHIDNNPNLEFPYDGWKLKKGDQQFFEHPGGQANQKEHHSKFSDANHDAKVVNVNLSSLINNITVNNTTGISDIKRKVEEALLEVLDSAISIQ